MQASAEGRPSLGYLLPSATMLKPASQLDNEKIMQGHFRLDNLHVGRGAVLRKNSRLMTGARMEPFSTLLEHTLVFPGEPWRSMRH